jgi:hypothetical protein
MEIKHNPNAGRWPLSSELVEAELAVNTGDGKLFVKMHDGTVMHINPAGGGGGGSDPLQAAQRAFAANLLFG